MTVPYAFGSATAAIPLSQLDSNFNTPITLGNTAIQLGNTVTTLNNMTLANVTVSSGSITTANVTITGGNISGVNLTLDNLDSTPIGATTPSTGKFTTLTSTGTATLNTLNLTNALGTTYGGTGLTSFTANGILYASSTSALTTGSALTFDGTLLANTGSSSGATLQVLKLANSGAGANTKAQLGFFAAGTQYGQITGGYGGSSPEMNFQLPSVSAGLFTWGTSSGAEDMRLTSTGLGIGTSSPAYKLDVAASSARIKSVSAYSGLALWSGDPNTATRNWAVASSYNAYGDLCFIQSNAQGGDPITAGTVRASIDSSGNLLWGTTSAGGNNTTGAALIYNGGSSYASWGHITGTGSGTGYHQFLYNGGVIGSITQSGTTAVLYNITSDQRLKENIQDAASASELIDALKVRQYDWKSDGNHQRFGFVAQELVKVAPEAVHQPADPEEMMAVDYSKLVPMLVKEIQQLRARVAQLEAKGA